MAVSSGVPTDWWDGPYQKRAAERVDPHVDLVGFFEALSDVIEEYVPKVQGWVDGHGFTSVGQVLDLVASAHVQGVVTDEGETRSPWEPTLRQLWLHGLDADLISRMLGVDVALIEAHVTLKYSNNCDQIKSLHGEGLTNIQIVKATGIQEKTVRKVLRELGLKRNGTKTITPTQRALVVTLREAGHSYTQIMALADVNMDQVKNTLRTYRLEQSA